MLRLPAREHKRLIAIHGWSGIGLGLLLFVIVATGSVAVLGEQIGTWSSGALQTRSPLTRPIDAQVKALVAEVPPEFREEVDLSASAANTLRGVLRGAPGPDERAISFEVAPDGRVLHRFEGPTRDVGAADPAGALASFLVGVHVRLYVPEPWGYILTGVAGFAMMVAAISGFFIHRHLVEFSQHALRKSNGDDNKTFSSLS